MDARLNAIKEEVLRLILEHAKEIRLEYMRLDESVFRRRLTEMFKDVIKENRIAISRNESEEILSDIISYLLGLGPIDKLLKDPGISEVMVNGPRQVYIERNGKLESTGISFRDEQHLNYFIEKILSPLGRRITELEPYIDARLSDGSRVNIVRSPVSPIGPVMTIRKFARRILSTEDLIGLGTLDHSTAEFLKACVVSRLNILICGGASSGKTTLLNILGAFIPEGERVITIEDTLELKLPRAHTVPMETRPPNMEGRGEITIRNLLRNTLHMRPDRIIIGEVRSDEVLDMVQSMNTGHEGSMTTLHANSTPEALDRLEVLALMGSVNMSAEVAKRQIITAIDVVINMQRFSDGHRRLTHVSEVVKGKDYCLNDIIVFEEGRFKFSAKAPAFSQVLAAKAGYAFPGA